MNKRKTSCQFKTFLFYTPIKSHAQINRLTSGAGCAGRGKLLVLGDTGTAGGADSGGLLGGLGSILDLLHGIGGSLGLGGLLLLEQLYE